MGQPENQRWARKGIPVKRDFEATSSAQPDSQLKQMSVSASKPLDDGGRIGVKGTYSVTMSPGTGGAIKTWKDQGKSAEFVPVVSFGGASLWLEGIRESYTVGDVTLHVHIVEMGTGATWDKDFQVTVTPVIRSFTATPGTAPNVRFAVGNNGREGLITVGPGCKLEGNIITSNGYEMAFVQNMLTAQNGANGSTAGAVFVGGHPNYNLLPNPFLNPALTFPCLDSLDADDPTSLPEFKNEPNGQGDGQSISATDSPSFARTLSLKADMTKLDKLDFKHTFQVYLVAKYSDGSLYSVAWIKWQVNWYSHTMVSTIQFPNGVTADAAYTKSNDQPQKTSGPIYNNSVSWQAS